MKPRLAPSVFMMCLMVVLATQDSFAQAGEELRQEQEAIESGEGLSARAKKALFRARAQQDEGDFSEARDIMTEFMEGQPDRQHPLLLFNLALSHFALEQDALAYEDLKKAVAIEPRYGRAWLRLGEAAYNLDRFAEAGEAFSRAYGLTPDPAPEILYYAGVSLLTGQDADGALTALENLLTDFRAKAELDWYQALISAGVEAGKPGRVAPFIDQLLQDHPEEPRAWELAYQFAASREDYRGAATFLTITSYLRPLTRDETVQLGDLYAVISVPLQAARYYQLALDMPGSGDVENGRGREFERLASAWLAAHDHDMARTTLQAALAENESVGLWSLMGDLEYLDEDFEASFNAFSRACESDPDYGRGWLMMGYCALELGREPEARGHLEKAAQFPDQEANARSLLGRIGIQ